MDELETRVRRAQEAERIWNGELMRDARAHIEKALWDGFQKVPLRDDEGLRRVRMMAEAHKAYDAFFREAMNDGKMAQLDLKHKKSLRERIGI